MNPLHARHDSFSLHAHGMRAWTRPAEAFLNYRARLCESAYIGLYGLIVTNVWAHIAKAPGIAAGAAS